LWLYVIVELHYYIIRHLWKKLIVQWIGKDFKAQYCNNPGGNTVGKKGVIIYLNKSTIEELDIVRRESEQSRSELIRDIIKEFLNRPETREIISRRKKNAP